MRRPRSLIALVASALLCVACGVTSGPGPAGVAGRVEDPGALAVDLAQTRPTGPGPAFRPPVSASPQLAGGGVVAGLRCGPVFAPHYGVHVELFAANHGVQVPAGIGIVDPERHGAFVTGGRCRYPLSTSDPTGVIVVREHRGPPPRLAALFELWGQALSRERLGAFAGPVRAYVGGRRWRADPRAIPLRRHVQIVLEVGAYVQPHPRYLFPAGL